MSERSWRRLSILLILVVAALWWRDCQRPRRIGDATTECQPSPRAIQDPHATAATHARAARGARAAADEHDGDEAWDDELGPAPSGPDWLALAADHWAVRFLTPRPGETLFEYRDRVVPVAQLAVAPQRARVADNRARFVEAAGLDAAQERVLDAAVERTADDIKDRMMQAVLSGELLPPHVRPATAVAVARDVLDSIDRANREFRDALSPRQRALHSDSGFDIVDYLLFSTRWEDVLGVVE